ncbi:MAG: hypothetical protein Q8Q31_06055 [Nanoarchaeota archaeon]|nr:hypothetical protein [Nanoarchaeota archaeon]
MKVETTIRRYWDLIRTYSRTRSERQEEAEREYSDLYKRCFEGSEEEVERKLYAWDWVHASTRSRNYQNYL